MKKSLLKKMKKSLLKRNHKPRKGKNKDKVDGEEYDFDETFDKTVDGLITKK